MPGFVVLLKGVNVGKSRRVSMAEFKTLLTGLGCTSVTTLLNSGNALVSIDGTTSKRLAATVTAALRNRMGFDVPVVVKSAAEFERIVRGNELAGNVENPSRLLVAFAPDRAALEALKPIAALAGADGRWCLGRRAAYLHCPNGILESRAADALLGRFGKAVTTRNWATVQKLQSVLGRMV